MRHLFSTPIVITHMTPDHRLPDMPWLRADYGIHDSEWIVLFPEAWSALVDGDPTIAADLEIRLAMAFEIHKPRFVLVVGFSPATQPQLSDLPAEQVVRVVRSFQFPARVKGISVDVEGVARRLMEDAGAQLVPA